MIGAIIGDIVGSRFEMKTPPVSNSFSLFTDRSIFTDDTILSVAVADSIMNAKPYANSYKEYFRRYPYAGYGGAFKQWAISEEGVTANSFGNGSAMRVSPVAWISDSFDETMREAEKSVLPSHNHPESIKGAQAIAAATWMARKKASKWDIKMIATGIGYDIDASVSEDRPKFSSACSVTVPQAIWAFLESSSFEDAIRKAIMIGGDSDTLAAMAGAIAHAYYGTESIDADTINYAFNLLPKDLFEISSEFIVKYVDQSFSVELIEDKQEVADFGFSFV